MYSVENGTDEWLMQVDDDGVVTSCSRTGGQKGWQLFSISRWTKEDGQQLKRHLEIEFEEKKTMIFIGMMWQCSFTLMSMKWAFIQCKKGYR